MKKKIICMALVAMLSACLMSGCSKDGKEPATTKAVSQNVTTTAAETTTVAKTEPSTEATTVAVETTQESVPETTTVQEETTTVAETTEAVKETQAPSGAKSWDLLNNEPLNPRVSGNAELDNAVANFIANHTDDSMSMFQKVMACYEYYVHGPVAYVRGMDANAGMFAASDKSTTPKEMLWAIDMLNANQGCCYNYASALMYILRAFGYDAHLVTGNVGAYNGGVTPHAWVLVTLAGRDYTFDTDLDMNYYYRALNNGSAEPPVTTWFCAPVEAFTSFYLPEDYHTNLD